MNPSAISEPAWQAIGWAMLHFLWLGTAISALFWIIERLLLRRATPAARYSHGLVCLLALAIAAGFCVWQEIPETPAVAKAPAITESTIAIPVVSFVPTASPQPLEDAASVIHESLEPEPTSFLWIELLPWFWFGGSAVLTILLAFGLAGTWRLRYGTGGQKTSELQLRCDTLRARLGISRRVAVAISHRIQAPLMVGVFRPLIILPASAISGLSPAMLEWVLLHELAHVQRWDNAVIIFQRIVECALFFHPCVWIASRWVDREREYCCDRRILSENQDRDPSAYARTLASLAGVPSSPLASTMAGHAVVQRIRRVLREENPSSRGGGAVVGVLLVSLIAIALSFALPPATAEAEEPIAAELASPDEVENEPAPAEEPPFTVPTAAGEQLPPIPAAAPTEPDEPKPAAEATGNGFVARSYRVPPDLMSRFPGQGSLQSRLEKKGVPFPPGSLAIFDARHSIVALSHSPAAIGKICKLIEPHCIAPKPQVFLASKLELQRGDKTTKISAPSVVTRSQQRAKVEVIREAIYPTHAEGEKPAYDVTNIGLEIEFEPLVRRNSVDVEISGWVQIRLPKGTDIDQYFAKPELLAPPARLDRRPEFDVYRSPFKQIVKSGGSIELELGKVPGRRAILKRNRLEEGKITAQLNIQLIDPSGTKIDSLEELRATYPEFKLRPIPPKAIPPKEKHGVPVRRELAGADQLYSVALAAYDLGDFALAEASARTTLAHSPGDAQRLSLWKKANSALSEGKQHPRAKPGAWVDRSYRLRSPLMPAACASDPKALTSFMKRCGMALPEGATAKVGDDGETLIVHNLGREVERLETALAERVLLHSGHAVWVDVEVVKKIGKIAMFGNDEEADEKLPGTFSITAVFTEPQYQVVRRAIKEKAKIHSMPRRMVAHEHQKDVFKGSPLREGLVDWSCDLTASVAADGYTIDVTLAPELYQMDERHEKVFSSRKLMTSVTIWDGQWIALEKRNGDAKGDLIFIRVHKAKL